MEASHLKASLAGGEGRIATADKVARFRLFGSTRLTARQRCAEAEEYDPDVGTRVGGSDVWETREKEVECSGRRDRAHQKGITLNDEAVCELRNWVRSRTAAVPWVTQRRSNERSIKYDARDENRQGGCQWCRRQRYVIRSRGGAERRRPMAAYRQAVLVWFRFVGTRRRGGLRCHTLMASQQRDTATEAETT